MKGCVVCFTGTCKIHASSSFSVISGIALSEHTYCSHTVGVMEIVLHWQPCSNTFCWTTAFLHNKGLSKGIPKNNKVLTNKYYKYCENSGWNTVNLLFWLADLFIQLKFSTSQGNYAQIEGNARLLKIISLELYLKVSIKVLKSSC